jgi:hypothetical protein
MPHKPTTVTAAEVIVPSAIGLALDVCIEKINEAIAAGGRNTDRLCVDVEFDMYIGKDSVGMDNMLKRAILASYRQAGWNVKCHYFTVDDGHNMEFSLTLTAPKRPSWVAVLFIVCNVIFYIGWVALVAFAIEWKEMDFDSWQALLANLIVCVVAFGPPCLLVKYSVRGYQQLNS